MNANTLVLFFAVIICAFSHGMANETKYGLFKKWINSWQIPCFESIETGPCEAYMLRYAYDLQKESCVQFRYGGCEGNKNNFRTLEECLRECVTPRF